MSSVPLDPANGQNTVIVNLSDNQPPTMWIPSQQQKPYQCGLCSVMFDINIELIFHVRKHSFTKPYQCGYCKVSYNSNVELTLHHGKTHVRGSLFVPKPEPPKAGAASLTEGQEKCLLSRPASQLASTSSELATPQETDADNKSSIVSDSPIGEAILTSDCGVGPNYKDVKSEVVEMIDPNQHHDAEPNGNFEEDSETSRAQTPESKPDISDLKHVNDVDKNSSDQIFPEASLMCEAAMSSVSRTGMALRRKANSVKIMHKCAECKQAYKYEKDFKNHWCKPRKCTLCDSMLASLVTYKIHMKVKHGSVCTEIDPVKSVMNNPSAEEHVMNNPSTEEPVMNNPSTEEPVMNNPSTEEPVMNNAGTSKPVKKTSRKEESEHKCAKCGKCFTNKRNLNQHYCTPWKCSVKSVMNNTSAEESVMNNAHTLNLKPGKKTTSEEESAHKCSKCGKCFSYKCTLSQHWCPPRKCSICDTMLSSEGTYRSHMSLQHPANSAKIKHQCAECNRSYLYKSDLKKHWCKPRKCAICDSMLTSYKTYKSHMKFKHGSVSTEIDPVKNNADAQNKCKKVLTHKCPVCEKCFNKKYNLLNRHWCAPKKCSICDTMLSTRSMYLSHMAFQHPADSAKIKQQCAECKRSYLCKSDLKTHWCKPRKCSICDIMLLSYTSYKSHMKVKHGSVGTEKDPGVDKPANKRSHQCAKCGQSFRRKYYFNQHWCPPRKCSICDKRHTSSQSYHEHMLRVHSTALERPFQCSVCDKRFAFKANLKLHSISHENTNPFVCEFCGKSFRRPDSLKNHRNIHLNRKPHKCKLCPREFSSRAKVFRHEQIHRSDRRYPCDQCDKKFYDSGSLKRHALTHTDLRPHVCKVCSKTYRAYSAMKSHLKLKHFNNL